MQTATSARLARLAFWAAAAFAYVMAIIPGGEPAIGLSYDKANHMLAFLVLSLLARLGWPRSPAWIIATLLIAFGGIIELSQAMPLIHRDADWNDLAADTVATLVGLVAGTIALRLVRRRAER